MKKIVLGLLMSVVVVGVVNAKGPKGFDPAKMEERKTEMFGKIDANKDGKISRVEFMDFHSKMAEERFDKVEKADKDSISKDEFMKFKPEHKGHKLGGKKGMPKPEKAVE